jgi:hypothetical protein
MNSSLEFGAKLKLVKRLQLVEYFPTAMPYSNNVLAPKSVSFTVEKSGVTKMLLG